MDNSGCRCLVWLGLCFIFLCEATVPTGEATMNERVAAAPTIDLFDSLRLNILLWTLAQPVLVLGSGFLVASMIVGGWADFKLYAVVMAVLPIPLLLLAERKWGKRQDWQLEPKEFAEDGFWLAFGALLWIPLISDWYKTPISQGFQAIRDRTFFEITVAPETAVGLVAAAVAIKIVWQFIYYWLHRVSHESLFFWRIHATHHHITKMSCMRGDRTHPFEYLHLGLSGPIVLAFTGASDEVLAVFAALSIWNGKLNHSNLPLRSMPIYDWLFTTAPMHHVHHAVDRKHSDTNYGGQIILWDRVFGTYCGDYEIERAGAGKGVPLSMKDQLMLAFYPSKRLTDL